MNKKILAAVVSTLAFGTASIASAGDKAADAPKAEKGKKADAGKKDDHGKKAGGEKSCSGSACGGDKGKH